ncbi:MAG: Bax inhibitor-1/YccA family protein, partial [Pseudomonadota bacterium]
MADFQYARGGQIGASADMSVDAGLRGFMLGVYNKMALGLVLSAVLAFVAATVEPVRNVVFTAPLYYVIAFAPIVILLGSSFFMRNPSPAASGFIYWSVVSLIGLSMGMLMMMYGARPDGMTLIAKAFFVTAAAFGGLSLWGYTTKRDLSGFGSFLVMGLIGLIIASIVQIFLQSDMMSFIISCVGVLIFSGLTAYDTQRLKHTYYA